MNAIAIVGLACIYPDARTPGELWENVLAQRRAFRRLPPERLRAEDFYSADPTAPDRTYSAEGAVIEGYEFDRVAFRVVGSTFRAADLAHWLALDVASRALADAGFEEGRGVPRPTTGVLLGNSLTGEFSRANLMRLRWPYVRRVLDAALAKENWFAGQRDEFLARLEADYKSPFPAVGEETLAGGLSNTIAGRICNHFDLKGGGYTVDGACASSLLAVANACTALAGGDLDLALAGGVDLSLDPFELVGFAKTGALAVDEMRVFDKRSAGFWPGEGCGFVVLMRHADALAQGRRIYAVLRGWGISSDGQGGITRPEADGQVEALRRAYRRAGFGADTVMYCEGHGTGTTVGDATELEVLARIRREARRPDAAVAAPAVVGSVKANIGHTKAAAGVAGLIKATMAVHTQVLPPTTGCEQPHAQFGGPAPALRVLRAAELWPANQPLRASVSAMGFGGINVHVVLESVVAERRAALSPREQALSHSHQDAELFLFAGKSVAQLAVQVARVLTRAPEISRAELADLAAHLEQELSSQAVRAAVVAAQPAELVARLRVLQSWLETDPPPRLRLGEGVFLGAGDTPPRIAFLFPGQGSPTHLDGGTWYRRFEVVRDIYDRSGLAAEVDLVSTRVMQPAIVTASLAGLHVLRELGIEANAALGHSLGELAALHWAGAFPADTLLRIAQVRGAAMAELGSPTGAMSAVAAPWESVQPLLGSEPVTISGYNSPRQTVVAGEAAAISRVEQRAAGQGWTVTRLPVSHAFHTMLVAAATPALRELLGREAFAPLQRPVCSTITGAVLEATEDLRTLLVRQVTSPVRFTAALKVLLDEPMAGGVDLLIEVGPGTVVSGLVRDSDGPPVLALDAGGGSLRGLLGAVGAAFATGAPVKTATLFADRFTRPFALDQRLKFFVNPCELAPLPEVAAGILSAGEKGSQSGGTHARVPDCDASLDGVEQSTSDPGSRMPSSPAGKMPAATPVELIRRLVAQRTELPVSAIRDESRLLNDLHLNSITVGQLVSEAAKALGLPRVVGLTEFANASVAEVAQALAEMQRTGCPAQNASTHRWPPGVDSWVRSFVVELVETKRRAAVSAPLRPRDGRWQVFAPRGHKLAATLRQKLATAGSGGVVVCLPPQPEEKHFQLLLDAARFVAAMSGEKRFVVVQHGWGGAGFARTLHLETPDLTTCVVNVPAAHRQSAQWAVSEALAATSYTESHFDEDGRRWEPRLKLPACSSSFSNLGPDENSRTMKSPGRNGPDKIPLGPDDVLLVTGGGKGIAAECALALARATGVRLGLLGRAQREADQKLAENLSRFAAAGVNCVYVSADVTDAAAVRAAVGRIETQLGYVTGFLHGAGTNTPQLISALSGVDFHRTVAPKIYGARNALASLVAGRLKLFVTFSSIIARAGLRGEADYATANEWLTALTEEFQAAHPQCRCLALEWSVWSGVGMGERLGRIETLRHVGITPISVEAGVDRFLEAVRKSPPAVALVITGRFGEPPTLKLAEPVLPLRRFLDRPRVHYPGVELVVDAELSLESDPYLNDHALQKQKLFPAVLGLEAMAQAAMALTGATVPPRFEQVELKRPVTLTGRKSVIRLAALRRNDGVVDVCLRSEETDFVVDHFRACCRMDAHRGGDTARLVLSPAKRDCLALEPQRDLYGRILFHEGRFRRLRSYQLLKARECMAEIAPDPGTTWFGPYLPAEFVLGDPAGRDAALHAIQACVPHRRILPTGFDELIVLRTEPGTRFVRAKERSRQGNDFTYDVEVMDGNGNVAERWNGLHLRAVEEIPAREAWPEALLAPYLERRLEELAAHANLAVALEHGIRDTRGAHTDEVIHHALGRTDRVWRRPDGKPVRLEPGSVSAAHCGDFTLAVAAAGGVACDLESVTGRTAAAWRDLLGHERALLAEQIVRGQSESLDRAATRLWTAMECLKKIGQPPEGPLVLDGESADGWVWLRAGSLTIATCPAEVRGRGGAMVVAVAFPAADKNEQTAAAAR